MFGLRPAVSVLWRSILGLTLNTADSNMVHQGLKSSENDCGSEEEGLGPVHEK